MHTAENAATTARIALWLAMLSLLVACGQQTPSAASVKRAARTLATSLCEGCHGAEGRSTDAAVPIIAAQQQPYVELQLKAFRNQGREEPKGHEFMRDVSSKWLLSDQVVAGIAEYFSSQAPPPGKPGDPAVTAKGKRLYEKGSSNDYRLNDKGSSYYPRILPCSDCHGDNAQGIEIFPRLAGQHAEYLVKQMQRMHETERASRKMHSVIGELGDSEIVAVATYLQSK